ncbi:hypothetical protein DH2020_025490 [Rehmannia glutinosa]|uniref:Phosphorylated adapter RNA export protein n=1 Tax=Rehmannia glutinosa TaxID=99300 RepID=A0ABR0W281_REHGL
MEGGESLLDTLFDEEGVEDAQDVDMLDVEEGELIEQVSKTEIGESLDVGGNQVNQESDKRSSRRKKKKNKRKRGSRAGPNVTDINRFVLDACKRLRERKQYLMWTAVGCLGVSALSDLVQEHVCCREVHQKFRCSDDGHRSLLQISSLFGLLLVDAIQACGGQKTADGSRFRNGGGILWNIIKERDPNAYKEIMRKGREFEVCLISMESESLEGSSRAIFLALSHRQEILSFAGQMKQFKQPLPDKQGIKQQTEASSQSISLDANQGKSNPSDGLDLTSHGQSKVENSTAGQKRASVHDRIRVPVSYDDLDLLGVDDPKDELA